MPARNKQKRRCDFPSIYDGVHHVLAILLDADFITADKRYYTKTQHLGHIQLITLEK